LKEKDVDRSPDSIWTETLNFIRDEITTQSFETWLEPTKGAEIKDNQLIVDVPSEFFASWLEEHYSDLVIDILRKVTKNSITSIVFKPATGSSNVSSRRIPLSASTVKHPLLANKSRNKVASPPVLNQRYIFEEFVVGASNQFAHAAARAVAEKPAEVYNPLFIFGGTGLGKTHLMQAIGHTCITRHPEMEIIFVSTEQFMNEMIFAISHGSTLNFKSKYRNKDLLLIDDIHFLAGKESTQEEFFHTFNALYEAKKQIVVTSDRAPKEIAGLEERLISRFEWGLITDIQQPDLETRVAILQKKAERDNLDLPQQITYFIANRITSNIRELEGALLRILARSSLMGQEITLAMAEDVLGDASGKDVAFKINSNEIMESVATFFRVTGAELRGKKRTRQISYPRQVAMYLCRKITNDSLSDIGSRFGGRDHSTVLHACEKIEKQLEHDHELRNQISIINGMLSVESSPD